MPFVPVFLRIGFVIALIGLCVPFEARAGNDKNICIYALNYYKTAFAGTALYSTREAIKAAKSKGYTVNSCRQALGLPPLTTQAKGNLGAHASSLKPNYRLCFESLDPAKTDWDLPMYKLRVGEAKRRNLSVDDCRIALGLAPMNIQADGNPETPASNLPQCSGKSRHNCKGTLILADGHKYEGDFKDNKPNGQGAIIFTNGGKLIGQWKDGWANGQGTLTLADGTKYVGGYKDGKRNGQGAFTIANGSNYIGEWKDDKANGQGSFTFGDGNWKGDKYVGDFKDDKFNGQGIYNYNNGNKYVGKFKDDRANGFGTYTISNGDKYVGEWNDLKRNGSFIVSYAKGDTFSGDYTSDKRQGQGTYLWKDGSKYVGQWAAGVPTEYGLHTAANGSVLKDVKYTNAATYTDGGYLKSADLLTYELPAVVVAQHTVQQTVKSTQPISPTDADTDKRVALVIGNGKYVNSGYLPNPSNDARSIASALTKIGFDVSKGEDLDRAGMEQLLREFLRKAASSKVALFFFAGHGMQVNGKNYLIPVDAKLEAASDLNFGTVELDKILASLDDPTRATIIILDACRDNPLARTFASTSRSGAVGNGLAGYSALGSGTLIAFSTAPGQVALDGEGSSNSPFTQGLVKHLGTPGLEVRQMLTRVRADVAAATQDKQIPWDNSSLRGDVYLAGSPPESNVITQNQPSQPASDPAERAWGIIQNTTSVAVLDDFVRQFSSTVYGSLAKARLEEVKKSQISNGE